MYLSSFFVTVCQGWTESHAIEMFNMDDQFTNIILLTEVIYCIC